MFQVYVRIELYIYIYIISFMRMTMPDFEEAITWLSPKPNHVCHPYRVGLPSFCWPGGLEGESIPHSAGALRSANGWERSFN